MEKISDQFLQHILNHKTKLEDSLREEIIRVKAVDFLIYIFNRYNGAASMTHSFHLLFPFWKEFNLEDWKSIFGQVTDQNCGQYYLNYNFKSLLGIDAGSNEVKILPGIAVFELEGTLRKRFEDSLLPYGITLAELENISNRLIREGVHSIRNADSVDSPGR